MADDVVDPRLLQARVNETLGDVKVLLTMAQNHDTALKDLNRQFAELIGALVGALNSRSGALEDRG
jgi:hypothetical protein